MPVVNNNKDTNFQNSIINVINNREELQKFLLASGNLGGNIHEETNLVVTNDKLNDGCVCQATSII